MSRLLRKMIWAFCSWLARLGSRAYVAGPELEDALDVCRRLGTRGLATTLGYWNGAGDNEQSVAAHYLAALDAIAKEKLDCYLSIKSPALGRDGRLLAELLERSDCAGVQIHFDSLGTEAADGVFTLITDSSFPSRRFSATLPGRWHRSLQDAELACKLGLAVRVVKGQWSDPDHPDIDPQKGFLEVVDRLAGRAGHVRIATHDAQLAREAFRRLQAANTSCELELLYGLPVEPALEAARAAGVRARIYVSYGYAFVPYCLEQIRQRPRILWWLLRDAALGRSRNILKINHATA